MSAVANYIHRNSVIHRLNPLTKLFRSLLLMTLSFMFKDPSVLTGLFLSIVLVAYLAGILKEMLPVKIPYTYAFMFIASLRFIPTFMNEMDQIVQAQRSRAHRLDSRNFITRFLSLCPLAIPLMVTSIKKAERLAISMETRGFGCGKRTYLRQINFGAADWVVCGSLVVIGLTGLILSLKGILN